MITTGIFSAIVLVVSVAVSMLGYIPIFIPLLFVLVPLISGIPFMLFLTKVKKFGMITIMGIIIGIVHVILGMGPWILLAAVVFGILADIIARSGNYTSVKKSILGYGVFSIWVMGYAVAVVFTRSHYYDMLVSGYGQTYADTLMKYMPSWIPLPLLISSFVFDPRTKMLLVVTIATVLVGGRNGGIMYAIKPILTAVPLLLFLCSGKWKAAAVYTLLYGCAYGGVIFLLPVTSGVINFLIVALGGLLTGFMPGIAMGSYLVNTTTVSQFMAAMERIHLSRKLSIPLSVVFRFFPTVWEEYGFISNAMRMRGIRFGGRKPAKMLEYRIVPLMISCVNIGEELSAAALTRGLGAPVRRTNICEIGFEARDYAALLLCVFSLICMLLTNLSIL